jgi:bacteriorhodopsin
MNDKEESSLALQFDENHLVRLTFNLTYVLLMTTATITIIEALRNKDPRIRHILNIETCISVVAAYFYGEFIKLIQENPINYKQINQMRYSDWFITTPMMLLVLCLVLAYNNDEEVHLSTYGVILALNILMLLAGYLGTIGQIARTRALFIGFLAFFAMFAYIWFIFLQGRARGNSLLVYMLFFVIWSIYGLVYLWEERKKNMSYNVLDLVAKCLVGLFLWAYFTHILVV